MVSSMMRFTASESYIKEGHNEKFYDAYSKYQSDAWKLDAVDNASRYISKINKSNVYAYRFDWDEEPKFLGMNFAEISILVFEKMLRIQIVNFGNL